MTRFRDRSTCRPTKSLLSGYLKFPHVVSFLTQRISTVLLKMVQRQAAPGDSFVIEVLHAKPASSLLVLKEDRREEGDLYFRIGSGYASDTLPGYESGDG